MIVTRTQPHCLTPEELTAWSRLQQGQACFNSPFFRPEFTQSVAKVRSDVEVAVLSEAAQPVGFFPYQRCGRAAKPVGGRLSDYQGVIAEPCATWVPVELLRQCELDVWRFDHLLVEQAPLVPYHRQTDLSPYLDLSQGYAAYAASLSRSGHQELQQTLRKERKLAREAGSPHFELDCRDATLFERLLKWKAAQYRRTKVTNVFHHGWTRDLLRAIWSQRSPWFQGLLSVLRVDDQPIALHFGMRSEVTLHWWFPAYDPDWAAYSPGRLLLTALARACPAAGITRIDLGRGVAPYKARIMSGATAVAEGSIDRRSLVPRLASVWRQTRAWIRRSPLYQPARLPGRVVHRLCEWIDFR